jgi:ATP-dependent helicase/nuclease subunit A
MILVDEFQDTDPLQYEIVLFLGERAGSCASDAYEADLEPGRLFVVGDPKQSIYRFRGADYEAFLRATSRIVRSGGRELRLTANFRSVGGVVGPVNALFEKEACWVERAPYQPPYIPISARWENGSTAPAVEVWTVGDAASGPTRAAERRDLEARILARGILRLKEERAIERFGEVTVLLRAFSPLPRYLRAFREAGVPFVVAGGREFLARPEVSHLLSILRALAIPSDPVALLAYLRSPAGGVPDGELAAFAAEGGEWSLRASPDAGRLPCLAAACERLRRLEEETRELPAGAVVGHALRASRLLTLSAVAFEGPQRVANLRKLAAFAAAVAADGRRSLLEVLDAIEEERTLALEADSPLADEGSVAGRVLTVHAAK